MSSPEIIPPLPPPLPTHSRSLSGSYSSSSSSAGSPAQKSSAFAGPSNKRIPSSSLARSHSRGFGPSSSLSSSSPPLSRSSSFARRTGDSPAQRSPAQLRRAAANAVEGTSTSHSRAVLDKVSPSLSHARYASSPGSTSSVGLRNNNGLHSNNKTRREPLGLGLGIGGAFARGLGQLPSPPHTSSDGFSNASNTVRSRDGMETEIAAVAGSEGRPERPPKSEARLSISTPPKKRTLPSDLSSLDLSSSSASPSRLDHDISATASATSPKRSQGLALGRRDSRDFPDPSSPAKTSAQRTSSRAVDLGASAGSESDASATTAKGNGDLRGKARAREASLASLEGKSEDVALRREARSRKAEELKAKNQKILDCINCTPSATASQKSSPDSLTTSLLHRASHPSPEATDEFGTSLNGGSIRRSSTLSGLAIHDRDSREADRRTRTFGTNPRRSGADDLPERSYTSMSTYSPGGSTLPRRSDLVGSERTRAVSSFGDNAERDREMAADIRRMASRDMLSSAGAANSSQRVRRRASQADLLLDQAQRTELPDSPAIANTTSPSIRHQPALPQQFLDSPSPSLSARLSPRLDLDLSSPRSTSSGVGSPSIRERINSPRLYSSRTASPLATPDPDRQSSTAPSLNSERRWQSQSEGQHESSRYESTGSQLSRPPRASRAAPGSGDSGSGGVATPARARRKDASTSEDVGIRSRSTSRAEVSQAGRNEGEGVFRNGQGQRDSLPRSSSRYDYSNSGKERRSSAEVGSDAWMAEFQDLRRRTAQSRAGSSGGANSAIDVGQSTAPRLERDRTVRALNALASDEQSPLSPTASSNRSSPQKRGSGQFSSDRPRRISFADASLESPASNNSISRSESARLGAGSRMSMHRSNEHQGLLFSAFERFELYFTSLGGQDTPSRDSADLVKRMQVLVGSTTKLNSGLRSLVSATTEAQIVADLDEGVRSSTVSIAQFEKSIHSLLRASDDQVRSLTEDLIAFTRFERERNSQRQAGDGASRPASRASNYRAGTTGPSPRRLGTASPLDTSSSTFSRGLPSSASRQTLRDPLVEEDRDMEPRRHTMSVSSSRSRYGTESPTPASGRRESSQLTSPLGAMDGFSTARRASMSSGSQYSQVEEVRTKPTRSELGLPTSASSGRQSLRRGKGSSTSTTTLRATTPPHLRYPTSSSSSNAAVVDSTNATTVSSPTRHQRDRSSSQSIPFPKTSDRTGRRASIDLSSATSSSPEEIRAQRRMEVEQILRRTSKGGA